MRGKRCESAKECGCWWLRIVNYAMVEEIAGQSCEQCHKGYGSALI